MACCGGKKDVAPISKTRYFIGITIYFLLFSALTCAIAVLSIFSRRMANVRRFQARFFLDQFREILQLDDIELAESEPKSGKRSEATSANSS